jgi:NADPH-dependent curcumin reductase CurA
MNRNCQWLYAKQPTGKIGPDTFQWHEAAMPVAQAGEVLVKTRMLSLDPANRAWMMGKTYRDALEPGQVMSGFTIGEVVESQAAGLAPGDIVEGDWGWQEYAALPARRLVKRTTKAPLELLVGPLSVTGLTAYFGLLEIGQPKPGDTVLVSAAAGAVGTMAARISATGWRASSASMRRSTTRRAACVARSRQPVPRASTSISTIPAGRCSMRPCR